MAVTTSRGFVIDATPLEVLDVMMNVEALPEWSAAHQSSTVLERDDDGRPLRSMSTLRVAGLTDEQVLEYVYPDGGFGWRLVSSRRLKRQDATYNLRAEGARTRVEVRLTIEPAVPVPSFIVKLVVQAVADTATDGLIQRVHTIKNRTG